MMYHKCKCEVYVLYRVFWFYSTLHFYRGRISKGHIVLFTAIVLEITFVRLKCNHILLFNIKNRFCDFSMWIFMLNWRIKCFLVGGQSSSSSILDKLKKTRQKQLDYLKLHCHKVGNWKQLFFWAHEKSTLQRCIKHMMILQNMMHFCRSNHPALCKVVKISSTESSKAVNCNIHVNAAVK